MGPEPVAQPPAGLLSAVAVLPAEPPTRNPFVGRGAHAAFMALVAGQDPVKAQALHVEEGPRPFTVSSFLPVPPGQGAGVRSVRFTCLEAGLCHLLREAVASGRAGFLVLDDVSFPVLAWHLDGGHAWSAATDYQGLAARWFLGKTGLPRKLTLEFVSPTTFHSGGHNLPFPLPGLVFGSLLERWNAISPIPLDPQVRALAEEHLVVSRHRLETHMVPLAGGRQVGFTGVCEFTSLSGDPYWLAVVNLLADFAFYAGVGAKTTMGLGQCRRVQARREG